MPKASIHFFSDSISFNLRDRRAIRLWLARLAKAHKKEIGYLNYVFVSDNQLLKMNQRFLSHNTFTDIITFPGEQVAGSVNGEIYISIDRVRDNARKFGVSTKDELHRVMAHGLLHLCGFNDKSSREQRVMRSQEEKALDLRTF